MRLTLSHDYIISIIKQYHTENGNRFRERERPQRAGAREPDCALFRVCRAFEVIIAVRHLRRAGGAYSPKLPFQHAQTKSRQNSRIEYWHVVNARDVSGLSGCLAVIGDLSRCSFVQFDRGAHLL
jgi:hypothetical protein